MFDPETFLARLVAFAQFCWRRPFIAVLFVAIFMVGAGHLVLKAYRDLGEYMQGVWKTVATGSWQSRAGVGVVAVGLVALSAIVVQVLRRRGRPRPEIEKVPPQVIRREFVLQWSYRPVSDADCLYEVQVRSSSGKHVRKTRSPSLRVDPSWQGPLHVRVRANEHGKLGPASKAIEFEYYSDSVERVLSTGYLIVGVHPDRSTGLFCFEDLDSDGYQGFDIDLIDAIVVELTGIYRERGLRSDAQPIRARFRRFSWPEILDEPAKLTGIDAAISSISITAERRRDKRLIFSDPYCTGRIGLVRNAGPSDDANVDAPVSLSELRGCRVAVHHETTAMQFAVQLKDDLVRPEVVISAATNQDLFALLKNNEVDVVLYDYYRALPEVYSTPGWTLRQLASSAQDSMVEQYGIAFARANKALCGDVNEALKRLGPARMEQMLTRRKAPFLQKRAQAGYRVEPVSDPMNAHDYSPAGAVDSGRVEPEVGFSARPDG